MIGDCAAAEPSGSFPPLPCRGEAMRGLDGTMASGDSVCDNEGRRPAGIVFHHQESKVGDSFYVSRGPDSPITNAGWLGVNVDRRVASREVGGVGSGNGYPAPVQKSSLGEDEGASADRRDALASFAYCRHPSDQHFVFDCVQTVVTAQNNDHGVEDGPRGARNVLERYCLAATDRKSIRVARDYGRTIARTCRLLPCHKLISSAEDCKKTKYVSILGAYGGDDCYSASFDHRGMIVPRQRRCE